MMQQRTRATKAAPTGRNGRKVLSPSLSDASDENALPTRFVSGGAARRVGGVDDNDYETSSYEETETSGDSFSDNSEEYVPLAFGYINSSPRRRAGAPAPLHAPSGVSEEADEKESMSLSDAPLEVFLQHDRTKRRCGKGAKDMSCTEVASSLSFHDDEGGASSVTSASLPVAFERRKRVRMVGKVKASTYEVSEAESSISLADEDEAPLNAQLIHTLIKRLRNAADDVPLEAFDFVDFNDQNFKEELAPLKKIQVLLAEKASNPIVASAKRDKEIKEALQSLPPAKAVASKVKAIKSRQIRSSQPQNRVLRGREAAAENAEAIAKLVRDLKDPKAAVQLRAFDEVDWDDRNFDPVLAPLQQIRAHMEAREVATAQPAEGTMDNVSALDDKIKTAILALPSEEAMAATVNAVRDRAMSSGPSNGDAIRSLVARLKEPGQAVQKCEFDKLDWNDTDFRRELEPLQQIRACLEAKEVLHQRPSENVLARELALDGQIKSAILSLPPERAIAVKTQMLKMRQVPAAAADGPQPVKVAKMSAPASTTKKLRDSLIMASPSKKARAKEGNLSASNSQVMQVGARVISSQQPKQTTKESTALSAAPKKVRRARSTLGRSVSFSKVEDAPPGEIVDKDQELPENTGPQPLHDAPRPPGSVPTSQRVSRVPSRPVGVKKPERRPRSRRPNNNVSFGSIPDTAAGVIEEEEEQLANTKRKSGRRRGPSRLGRSISMTSLPDLEAGELVEEPTLAASKPQTPSTTRSVTPAATARPRRLRPAPEEVAGELGDGNTTLRNAAAPNPERKKRRAKVGNNNNRSCSFLEVGDVEAHEIPDSSGAQLKGAGSEGEVVRAKKGKKVLRRRRPGGEGGGRGLEFSNPDTAEAGELQETSAPSQAPVKGRRSNVHRPRSANASMIVDAEAGEIVEKADETSVLYTPSRTATPFLDEPSTKRADGLGALPKPQRLSRGPSDLGATGRRRRQRMHMSKELSISVIPDNAAGEIVENAPTSLASSVNGMPSLGNGTMPRHLPRVGAGSERLFTRPGQPATSMSLRSSTEGRRGDFAAPRTDTAFMTDPLPSAPIKPAAALRRSAESAPRNGSSAAAKPPAVGNPRVPPVRASS